MSGKLLPLLVAALVVAATSVSAQKTLPEPAGKVVLVVDGNVSRTNANTAARFDMAMLKAIETHVIRTQTPWTEGMQVFEGPLVGDVLKAAGALGSTIKAIAINDYAVEIPLADLKQYPVILAHTLNGKAMPVREKGPIWVIYPWSDNPEIRIETYYAKSIWQVKKLTIQ